MERIPADELRRHHVLVGGESPYQQHARIAQAKWREAHGYPIGLHREMPLGSRLAMPWARVSLSNFVTPAARDAVRREVLDSGRDRQKLFGQPRIFNDLLSSQPLCFNVFAGVAADLTHATDVGRRLWPDMVGRVRRIEFEWSPGRSDDRYLGNRSAFDVAWFVELPGGGDGVIGIEVKYHENMRVGSARHQVRYDELATLSGAFACDIDELRRPPLQQLWLDHLLLLAMRGAHPELTAARFVVCAPLANGACAAIVEQYRRCLADTTTFTATSLDDIVDALDTTGDAVAAEIRRRYLPWTRPAG